MTEHFWDLVLNVEVDRVEFPAFNEMILTYKDGSEAHMRCVKNVWRFPEENDYATLGGSAMTGREG